MTGHLRGDARKRVHDKNLHTAASTTSTAASFNCATGLDGLRGFTITLSSRYLMVWTSAFFAGFMACRCAAGLSDLLMARTVRSGSRSATRSGVCYLTRRAAV